MYCLNANGQNNGQEGQNQPQLHYYLTYNGMKNHIRNDHRDCTTKPVNGYEDGIYCLLKHVTNLLLLVQNLQQISQNKNDTQFSNFTAVYLPAADNINVHQDVNDVDGLVENMYNAIYQSTEPESSNSKFRNIFTRTKNWNVAMQQLAANFGDEFSEEDLIELYSINLCAKPESEEGEPLTFPADFAEKTPEEVSLYFIWNDIYKGLKLCTANVKNSSGELRKLVANQYNDTHCTKYFSTVQNDETLYKYTKTCAQLLCLLFQYDSEKMDHLVKMPSEIYSNLLALKEKYIQLCLSEHVSLEIEKTRARTLLNVFICCFLDIKEINAQDYNFLLGFFVLLRSVEELNPDGTCQFDHECARHTTAALIYSFRLAILDYLHLNGIDNLDEVPIYGHNEVGQKTNHLHSSNHYAVIHVSKFLTMETHSAFSVLRDIQNLCVTIAQNTFKEPEITFQRFANGELNFMECLIKGRQVKVSDYRRICKSLIEDINSLITELLYGFDM